MRWKIGAPPIDSSFQPETEGWQKVPFPGPYTFLLFALPVGVGITVLLVAAWQAILPENANFSFPIPGLGLGRLAILLLPGYLVVGFLVLILIHELLHAVGHPNYGLTSKSYIGAWPTKLMFYAVYLGDIPRNRYLVLGMLPFCVLTLLPLAVCAVVDVGAWRGLWCLVSVVNGFSSCGDLLMMPMLAAKVPARALIHDQGWDSYWKPLETPAPANSNRA